jgi:hypothetical protein
MASRADAVPGHRCAPDKIGWPVRSLIQLGHPKIWFWAIVGHTIERGVASYCVETA